jgi:DNA-binding XRE family transcriptional regulator
VTTTPTSPPTAQDFAEATADGRAMQQRAMNTPRSRAEYDRIMRVVTMRELRRHGRLTQQAVAEALGVNQSRITQFERQSDFLVSSLARYVEATGGRLSLTVTYPDGDTATLQLPHTEADHGN